MPADRRRNAPRALRAGAFVLLAMALAAVAAPWIAPAPDRVDLERVLLSPGGSHWLGTDGLGRDAFARLVHGARTSLSVGALATLFSLLVGVPLGAVSGYRGGTVDAALSRVIEAMLCLPALVLALAILTTWPTDGGGSDSVRLAAILGATGWTAAARYTRAEVLRLRDTPMLEAARATGAGTFRVVVRHLLPAAVAPVTVTASFGVGAAILAEASLSFLGLGMRPPSASWGSMLSEAAVHVERAWWLAVFPGGALFAAVLSCNLVGEGLRDWLDPERRRS